MLLLAVESCTPPETVSMLDQFQTGARSEPGRSWQWQRTWSNRFVPDLGPYTIQYNFIAKCQFDLGPYTIQYNFIAKCQFELGPYTIQYNCIAKCQFDLGPYTIQYNFIAKCQFNSTWAHIHTIHYNVIAKCQFDLGPYTIQLYCQVLIQLH